MLYFLLLGLLIIGALMLTRLNTVYHPKLLFKKYFTVNDRKLQKLLISKVNLENFETESPKEHHNKLLYLGLIEYIIWALILLFSIAMLFLVPEITITPITYSVEDIDFSISTLNKVLPLNLWLSFLSFNVSFLLLNVISCNRDIKGKILKIIYVICVVVLFVVSFASLFFLFEAIAF